MLPLQVRALLSGRTQQQIRCTVAGLQFLTLGAVYFVLFLICVVGMMWSSIVLVKTRTPSGGYREADDEDSPGSMEMARFEIGEPDPEAPPARPSANGDQSADD